MRDPFRPNSNAQLIREAQIGLTMVALLLFLFVYVAYYRISGYGRSIPEHVRRAPVAESVWPNSQAGPEAKAQPNWVADLVFKPSSGRIASPLESQPASVSRDSKVVPAVKIAVNSPAVPFNNANEFTPSSNPPNVQQSNYEEALKPSKSIAVPDPRLIRPHVKSLVPSGLSKNLPPETEPTKNMAAGESRPKQPSPIAPVPEQRANPTPANESIFKPNQATGRVNDDNFHPVIKTDFSHVTSLSRAAVEPRLQSPRPIETNLLRNTDQEVSLTVGRDGNFEANDFRPIDASVEMQTETNYSKPEVKSRVLIAADPEDDAIVSVAESVVADFPISKTDDRVDWKTTKAADPNTEQIGSLTSSVHVVQSGESFWTIAQQHYEDGRYFRALYLYNQFQVADFEHLIPGSQIDTPAIEILAARFPEFCPNSTDENLDIQTQVVSSSYDSALPDSIYQTNSGDTLFKIAQQRLGQASRYLEILNLNKDRLPVGVGHLSPLPGRLQLLLPQ